LININITLPDLMLINSLLTNKIVYHRSFHTSSPRHVHPIIWVFLKPVLKGVAFLTGRWWEFTSSIS